MEPETRKFGANEVAFFDSAVRSPQRAVTRRNIGIDMVDSEGFSVEGDFACIGDFFAGTYTNAARRGACTLDRTSFKASDNVKKEKLPMLLPAFTADKRVWL